MLQSEKHKKKKDRLLFEFVCDKFANYKSAYDRKEVNKINALDSLSRIKIFL